ncbi:UvrD-helicase domain-containing protein [Candidatus Dojkabacteria bacterium]|nr:UvrD-helicase domain-containing protein [Candidatus Dojkabacteria bacterium]
MNLSDLNPQQREATGYFDGSLLILAGAGSGKTRVLTCRIANIIEKGLASPSQILAVTFTNKAAGEMKERIFKLLKELPESPEKSGSFSFYWIGTFHSICLKILKMDGHLIGLDPKFSIYDKADQLDTVKEAMDRLFISKKEFVPNAILASISSSKNELIGFEEYSTVAQGYFQETVAKIYPEYQKTLKENNAVDFDDLIMKTVQLLQKEPEVLQKYQKLFKYVLVDEYQDTNHAQYKFILLLTRKYQNIAVVGDDDQSIYKFRGATIKNILNFEKDFPNTKVIKLEQNYRSTKKILEASYGVISQNKNRKEKKLWTENIEGEKIIIYKGLDEKAESEWVSDKIRELLNQEISAENIVVLYRTNAQSRVMEEALLKVGQPYRIIGNVRFYERKEIKDIIAYLRIIYNPQDDLSFKRIVNVPRRGVGPKAVKDLENEARLKQKGLFEHLLDFNPYEESTDLEKEFKKEDNNLPPALSNFRKLLVGFFIESQKTNVVELIKFVLDKTGYLEWLDDGSSENEARIENIKELISVATKYQSLSPEQGLAAFMDEISLIEQESIDKDLEKERVTLMTIHSAKGLEFDYVFIIGMEEGLFPHSRSYADPTEMEEERRLAYVGITRARRQLFLTHTETRTYFGSRQNNLASRFLEDIPVEIVERESYEEVLNSGFSWNEIPEDAPLPAIEVQPGDRVLHPTFGKGVVLSLDSEIIKIDFAGTIGTKELAIEYAVLEKI